MRRTLTITAAIFILCIATVNTTKGQFSGGDGSVGNPYIITTATELAQLATFVNTKTSPYADAGVCYKLNNDISLTGYQADSGWIPIGARNTSTFTGIFDGNNKTITELYINNTSLEYLGLFGFVSNSVIKNLGVVNVDISSSISTQAGGVVGRNQGSTISNCYSTGIIIAAQAGGVAGYSGFYGIVSNCYSTATINASSASYSQAGGVVGMNGSYGTVSNCYSIGTVTASSNVSSQVGGVVGQDWVGATVSDCAALNTNINYAGTTNNVGRVSGTNNGTLTDNIAFNNMLNPTGNTTWNNKGLTNLDGLDITLTSILADGTLGGRFTSANGWITENGKLPSLFGETVDMPEHLAVAPSIITSELPNGTIGEAYSQTLSVTGTPLIIWSIESGSLPIGLALDTNTGEILGVPTVAGTFNFIVKASNNGGSDAKALSIVINPPTYSVTFSVISGNGTLTAKVNNIEITSGGMVEDGNNIVFTATPNSGYKIKELKDNGVTVYDTSGIYTINNIATAHTVTVEFEQGTSITDNYVTNPINIYPNPAQNTLYIQSSETVEQVRIYDVSGRELIQLPHPTQSIDISHLANGTYIIKVKTAGGETVKRIIVND